MRVSEARLVDTFNHKQALRNTQNHTPYLLEQDLIIL